LDFDALLSEKVRAASDSRIGRMLYSLSEMLGGVRRLAFLNVILTSSLGVAITLPIYSAGGPAAASPTAFFTLFLISLILLAVFSVHVKSLRRISSKALAFAIIFSLPFGLLSLPLLRKISSLA
jgi:uncharacterized membrane protein YhaH (DUF805 family)